MLLEAALTEAKVALSRAAGQDVLVEQIIKKLAASDGERPSDAALVRSTRGFRKKGPPA